MTGEPLTLAFIGLGVVGGRMCRSLACRSGETVIGYDIVPACVQTL